MGGGVITPPYNGWYETYEFKFYDLLIKADNLNTNLSFWSIVNHKYIMVDNQKPTWYILAENS